jgi:hypothetical protein
MMAMWLVNNRQFLFTDPEKNEFVLRIIGSEMFKYFQQAGLDEMVLPDESATTIAEIIDQMEGNVSDDDLQGMVEAGKVPRFPILENPKEKNPDKIRMKPKMSMNEMRDEAQLIITPEDLEGTYDYIASVRSMALGAEQEMLSARQQAVDLVMNPQIQQMLMSEGIKVNIKDLLIDNFNDLGMRDAEKYFGKAEPQVPQQNMLPPMAQGVEGASPMDTLTQLQGMGQGMQEQMPTPEMPQQEMVQ